MSGTHVSQRMWVRKLRLKQCITVSADETNRQHPDAYLRRPTSCDNENYPNGKYLWTQAESTTCVRDNILVKWNKVLISEPNAATCLLKDTITQSYWLLLSKSVVGGFGWLNCRIFRWPLVDLYVAWLVSQLGEDSRPLLCAYAENRTPLQPL